MNKGSGGPVSRILKAAAKVEPNEVRATILSFIFVFTLMAAYFIIRPVRDAMASDWTRAETSWLWTATFFFSVVGVSLYGFIISRVSFSKVVPGVYVFFCCFVRCLLPGFRNFFGPDRRRQGLLRLA